MSPDRRRRAGALFRTLYGVRLLIVDGSANVRARMAERFEEEGFDVTQAADGQDALAAVASAAPWAIVFDLHGAGIHVLEKLRRAAPKAMIVVVTHEAHELARSESLRRGADFFFDKVSEFDRAVHAIVRSSAMTRLP